MLAGYTPEKQIAQFKFVSQSQIPVYLAALLQLYSANDLKDDPMFAARIFNAAQSKVTDRTLALGWVMQYVCDVEKRKLLVVLNEAYGGEAFPLLTYVQPLNRDIRQILWDEYRKPLIRVLVAVVFSLSFYLVLHFTLP